MLVGILKESGPDRRVAVLPEVAGQFVKLGLKVAVENDAGKNSFAYDEDYKNAGADVLSKKDVLEKSDLVIKINQPTDDEVSALKTGQILLSIIQPLLFPDLVKKLNGKKVTIFGLDVIPRTTRAQSMDILSSQASVAGYKAVLMAATHLAKFFPMMITAAGSITPAKMLILGAGVAGLQAVATARKLGAVVEVFDTRPAVKEEVLSLGGKFVEVEGAADASKAGGYAVEQTEEYKQRQAALIQKHAAAADVIITTAQIPGRKAPLLITKVTVDAMKKGSVIVDLAASTGGNCEVTKDNEVLNYNDVTVIGNSYLASTMPSDASKMFSKNVLNFLKLIVKEGNINLNFEDDIVKGTCIAHDGQIVHKPTLELINKTV